MKKFILISAVLSVLFVFSACFGGVEKVNSLSFHTNDGTIDPQYYSEDDVVITPDYKNRTLHVDYSKFFPGRTSETKEEDLKTTGDVGGEYFDRFEHIVTFVKDYKIPEDFKVDDYLGAGVFSVNLVTESDEILAIDSFWNVELSDLKELQDFYLDLVNLLTQEVPV